MYEVVASVQWTVASGTPDLTTSIFLNDGAGSLVLAKDVEPAKVGTHFVTVRTFFYADASIPYDIGLRCSSTSATTIGLETTFTVTNLGDAF